MVRLSTYIVFVVEIKLVVLGGFLYKIFDRNSIVNILKKIFHVFLLQLISNLYHIIIGSDNCPIYSLNFNDMYLLFLCCLNYPYTT